MLIPQYSLRWLLALVTVCAVIFSIMGLAVQGSHWAMAVSVAVVSLVIVLLVHAFFFSVVWLFSLLMSRRQRSRRDGSPFGKDVPTALLVAALTAWCGAASGQSGMTHTMLGAGLKLDVDARWFDTPGYRPVRITVTPSAPVTADRTLTLDFAAGQLWGSDDRASRASIDLDLPAGTGPVAMTFSVPQFDCWNRYSMQVTEDGKLRKSLCITPTWVNNPLQYWNECFPAVLLVGNKSHDTTELAAAINVHRYYTNNSNLKTTVNGKTVEPLPTALSYNTADLPQRWIDYSSVDIVCLSWDKLLEVSEKRPDAFQAICRWTAAGGNLWITEIGRGYRRLDEVERRLDLRPGSAQAKGSKRTPYDAWASVRAGKNGDPRPPLARGVPTDDGSAAYDDESPVMLPQASTSPSAEPTTGHEIARLRRLSAGQVLVFAEDPFPGKQAEWSSVFNALDSRRWLWWQRHGLSVSRPNNDFWNFLIPGVGLAPVIEFCVLITLFVVVIGPVNYWLLRRRGKLHLLVLTIPAAAGTVTLMLFAYALVADGLSTRVRVRSVTDLDQQSGRAVCWSRLSHYAGLAPWNGLTFPADTAVIPYEQYPRGVFQNYGSSRETVWRDDQRLVNGWLASRTPTQFITIRSRKAEYGLQWFAAEGDKPPRVKNNLPTAIERLLARGPDGKFYRAESIAAGATAVLRPTTLTDGHRPFQQASLANKPALPPGIGSMNTSGFFTNPRRFGYWGGVGSNLSAPSHATNLLENMLADCDNPEAAAARMGPGGYLAIVAQSPEVVLGVEGAREEGSFHVIRGRF